MVGTTRSLTGHISLKSVKSAANQLPRRRVCPWVSGWFTVPQFAVKTTEMLLALGALVMVCLWRSEGVTINDLNVGSYNFRNRLYFYVGLSFISFMYSVAMATLGFGGFKLPPNMQTLLPGGILLLWLLGAPTMSATVEELSHTRFARTAQLDTLSLNIATVLGFLSLAVFVCDILLGFLAIRSLDQSRQFAGEVQQSKSVVCAVRSGKSFAEAKRAAVSMMMSRRSQGGGREEAVTETSPLKSHEETAPET